MKKLILLFLLIPSLLFAQDWQEARMNLITITPADTVAGGATYLLQETFEAANGTNLYAYNSWAGSNSDTIEISTDYYHSGASSLKVAGSDTSVCYKTFTTQSTGKHTYSVWIFSHVGMRGSIVPSNGALVWSPANWPIWIRGNNTDLQYTRTTAPTWVGFGATLSVDTWYHLEIELDLDADTFNAWIDGTQYVTNIALRAAGTTVNQVNFDDATATVLSFWDDLNIYTGARVP